MKKKFRDIVVDDVKYAWQARADDDYPARIKIWKNKKVIIEGALSDGFEVTPKIISEIIEDFIQLTISPRHELICNKCDGTGVEPDVGQKYPIGNCTECGEI